MLEIYGRGGELLIAKNSGGRRTWEEGGDSFGRDGDGADVVISHTYRLSAYKLHDDTPRSPSRKMRSETPESHRPPNL